jgi:bacterial/archaeal transporter family protein
VRVLERKNDPQNTGETAGKALPGILHSLYARPVQSTSADSNLSFPKRIPKWLLWSLLTIVLWGTWGLVSKIASTGVDAYMNQLLYTAGLAPLMVFVAITVHREQGKVSANRNSGIFWAFFTGILGGVGNIAFFQALVKGGKASVVAPVTALFPMVTVLLALMFLKEKLGRTQWLGLALAFAAIYMLSA